METSMKKILTVEYESADKSIEGSIRIGDKISYFYMLPSTSTNEEFKKDCWLGVLKNLENLT